MDKHMYHLAWILVALLACSMPPATQALAQRDLSGLVGETISLPCDVDLEKCGDMHSIKWYRGSSRIFVFSESPKISRAEGDYVDRAELHYVYNSTKSSLEVKKLQVADEAVYKCEITYIEVREGCSVVQFINLTSLIKPEYLKISRDGTELQNSTVIGPFVEGTEMTLVCESGGGKPIPHVTWWNGTNKMNGDYTTESGANSVGTGKNRVQLTLSRGDLSAKYECRANNEALDTPMVSWVEVDINVRPLKLLLSGVSHHVVQGSRVVLECLVAGARPAAAITWYNGTEVIQETDDLTINTNSAVQADGTYETQSRLIFTATRYENEETLTCEATNLVIQEREEKPMKEFITLEVLYPPIVSVSPGNVTVNESVDILMFCEYEANPNALKSVKWFRDGQEISTNHPEKYMGGTADETSLLIMNSTRYDQGVYTCVLENDVGSEESNDVVYVSVHFKPIVRLLMDPPTPVRELDRLNITLMCKVESGNPDLLDAVRWFLDDDLLKELPECDNSSSGLDTFCDIDPSKLLLEVVGRNFHGNYSCEGKNGAGWGPRSALEELTIYYPPGAASLVFEPTRVVKRSSVTLSCSVDDLGRPEASTFRWIRGTHLIKEVTTANWTIDPVMLETQSNFTCYAQNEGGDGETATVFIDVFAPPLFIERLPPYTGALLSAQNINISCRVECSPICNIHWLKNDNLLSQGNGAIGNNASSAQYMVRELVFPPDGRSNDFESKMSTLIWNMSAWPGGQLDRIHDNANYTCQSSGNTVGGGVKSTTVFGVEYPPEKITVTQKVVNVIEGHIPETVFCSAKGYPEATYMWRPEGKSEAEVKGNALNLNYAMTRKKQGHYVCEASNRHGSITQKTFINVLFKPECSITQTEMDGKQVLICAAHANPQDVDFTWRIKNENDTIEENIEKKGLQSMLIIDSNESFRTYLCFTNNTVGMSIPCERDITGYMSGWWAKFDNDNMLIIIAVIVSAILMVIIICVIIIVICRRKRAEDKYPNPSTTKDKSPQELGMSLSDGLLQPDGDKAFYENLPFLGIQPPPNKPFKPEFSDLDYADVDYRSYGPINYKMASIEAAELEKAQNNNNSMFNNPAKPTNVPRSPSPDLL